MKGLLMKGLLIKGLLIKGLLIKCLLLKGLLLKGLLLKGLLHSRSIRTFLSLVSFESSEHVSRYLSLTTTLPFHVKFELRSYDYSNLAPKSSMIRIDNSKYFINNLVKIHA